jgi:hypothetical protein
LVSIDDIQRYKPTEQRVNPRISSYVPSSLVKDRFGPANDIRDTPGMFTGNNPYRFLEVVIQTGDLKGHFASVLDTRVFDGEVLATVRTDTCTINHIMELNMQHLKERQYVV